MSEHAEPQHAARPTKHATTKEDHARGSAGPSPRQVDTLAGPRGIGVVDAVEVGDKLVGETSVSDVGLFNLDHDEAAVRVRIDGDPELKLVTFPQRLRPSAEGYNPADLIRVAFQPTREGAFAAIATIEMAWGDRSQSLAIPIRAQAHAEGTPTWVDRAAADATKAQRDARATVTDGLAKTVDHARERNAADTVYRPVYSTRSREEFESALGGLKDEFEHLFKNRRAGIQTAHDRAVGFHRPEKTDDGLVRRLAILGIDIVTNVLSDGLASAAKAVIKTGLGEHLASGLTAAVKFGVKAGGTAVSGAIKSSAEAGSDEPAIAFFGIENVMLNDTEADANEASRSIRTLALPAFENAPAAAVMGIDAATSLVREQASSIADQQATVSSEHWIRYVAHQTIGSDKKSPALVDARHANQVPSSHGPQPFDGLVDIVFRPDLAHPDKPVDLVSAHLHGIKKETVRWLAKHSLEQANVPIRLTAAPTELSAETTIAILRDESHAFTIAEGPEAVSFLERKSPHADRHDGAHLVFEELLRAPLKEALKADGEK